MRLIYKLLTISFSFFLAFTDYISKIAMQESLSTTGLELSSFLMLRSTWNRGVSFGLMADWNVAGTITIVSLALVFMASIMLWRSRNNYYSFSICLIIGGALGNIYDRFMNGAVYDFICLHIGNHYWPAFNVADIYISAGVLLYVFSELYYPPSHKTSSFMAGD